MKITKKEQLVKQTMLGMKVEQEHADVVGGNQKKIRRMVKEHLKEDPKYYTKLERMLGKKERKPKHRRKVKK